MTRRQLLCPILLAALAYGPGDAVAKRRSTPQTKAPALTQVEASCHAWGRLTRAIAQARDAGESLVMSIATVRKGLLASPAGLEAQQGSLF